MEVRAPVALIAHKAEQDQRVLPWLVETVMIACATVMLALVTTLPCATAAEPRAMQRLTLDGVTILYGWYDDGAGTLTALTPSGFSTARVASRRITAAEAIDDQALRDAMSLKQEQLDAFMRAYEAAEPRRVAERERRAEAARLERERRAQAEAEEQARAERRRVEAARIARELAAEAERRRQQEIERRKAKAEEERALALRRAADAALLQALIAQQAQQPPASPPPPGMRWVFIRTVEDPVGRWVLQPIPAP